jgi:hypothetical protein
VFALLLSQKMVQNAVQNVHLSPALYAMLLILCGDGNVGKRQCRVRWHILTTSSHFLLGGLNIFVAAAALKKTSLPQPPPPQQGDWHSLALIVALVPTL